MMTCSLFFAATTGRRFCARGDNCNTCFRIRIFRSIRAGQSVKRCGNLSGLHRHVPEPEWDGRIAVLLERVGLEPSARLSLPT